MIELHTTGRTTLPYISGPLCQMISERMDADFAEVNQTHNFAFYRRFTLGTRARRVWLFQIPDDYYYFLAGFRVWYPLTDQGDQSPPVYFRVTIVDQSREMNIEEIPFNIITTPAQNQQPVQYRVSWLYTWFPAGKIQFEVYASDATDPATLDLMTEGLRIPRDFITQE